MNEATVIFIHIHKSGGSTLMNLLDDIYKNENIHSIDGARYKNSMIEFKDLLLSEAKDYKLVKGHQFYGIHEYLKGDSRYFAILRDPFSRIISLYNYLRQINLYPEINNKKMGIIDFVKSGHALAADNGMVRFISGCGLENVPYGEVNLNTLLKAENNIKKNFCFIGLSEEFNLSLIALKEILGWDSDPLYISRNITKEEYSNKEILLEEYIFLADYLKYDIALYNWVKHAFKNNVKNIIGDDWKKKQDDFENKLINFQSNKQDYKTAHMYRYVKRTLSKLVRLG